VGRGGEGGLMAMDKDGNITSLFNSSGMYRASIDTNIDTNEKMTVEIFKD
jgi:beta-aspartyl-peptidase (threonine type)